MSTSNQFTLGIISAGNQVSSNHIPVLKAMGNVNIAWLGDKDRERARKVGKAYGVTDIDLSEGLEKGFPAADAVLLAIPYGVREPYYKTLADQHSAVFVEKPFARTVAMHRALSEPFEEHALACGLNRRSWGIVNFCREVIATRMLGKLRAVRFGMGTIGGIAAGSHYLADPKISGGGMLFEAGVHGIDTVLYALGAQQAVVTSGDVIMDEGHDVHCDGLVSVMDAEGDTIPFEIEVSRLRDTINRLEFEFDNCTAFLSIFGSPALHVKSKRGKLEALLTDQKSYYPATWNQALAEFWWTYIKGLEERKVNYTSASQSILTTGVVEQFYALGRES